MRIVAILLVIALGLSGHAFASSTLHFGKNKGKDVLTDNEQRNQNAAEQIKQLKILTETLEATNTLLQTQVTLLQTNQSSKLPDYTKQLDDIKKLLAYQTKLLKSLTGEPSSKRPSPHQNDDSGFSLR